MKVDPPPSKFGYNSQGLVTIYVSWKEVGSTPDRFSQLSEKEILAKVHCETPITLLVGGCSHLNCVEIDDGSMESYMYYHCSCWQQTRGVTERARKCIVSPSVSLALEKTSVKAPALRAIQLLSQCLHIATSIVVIGS